MKVNLPILAALLLAPLAMAHATICHVDSTGGNDSNSGESPAKAWRSLEKVNAITFQAGEPTRWISSPKTRLAEPEPPCNLRSAPLH
jgi:hypothetical protein